ncbi:iron ABC transporter permease (plasmid) [Aliivibrio salmonicida]|uniref:Iron ion transport system, inner membrane component n=2 Tax=Aliivibrio salmonicida TaxID=40269 RepID=B6ET69_ALISL|nr:iron ABC transporter permease [Aliivibrio salmonicida]AZL83556.1 iron ABC transporter permease [Aliivibrio salmonicida]CAQ81959.1 iron ion transport system, inner membrane component [Aliivibrio salmonicida LFI1238]
MNNIVYYRPSRDKCILGLIGILVMLTFYSATLGRYDITFDKVIMILLDNVISSSDITWSTIESRVVELIRMPRILAAILIGIGLSVSGVAAQALFRNPLVDSTIIGVTSGAAFGGTLAILLFESTIMTVLLSFIFGMLSVFAVMLLARINGRTSVLTLVLVGVIISTFFGAAISIVKLLADPFSKLPSITYWLMGSLSAVSYDSLVILLLTVLPSSIIIYLLRYQMNIVSMGEERASALGTPFNKVRWIVLIAMAVISSGVVATAGAIGWVGLIIPHVARFLVGANHIRLIPTAALIGGIFMLAIDNAARTMSDAEIPIGIMTSLIGVPLFAFILRRSQSNSGWNND